MKNLFLCIVDKSLQGNLRIMNLIDTHTHLFTEEFDEDRVEVISRAIENGVSKMCLPAIDSSSFCAMLETRGIFPDHIFLMAGLHPCSVGENYKEELHKVEEFMTKNKVIGIGETGLDYHWDTTFVTEQKESLHMHCRWALEMNLPIILHTRDSIDDAIEIVAQYSGQGLKGIFHCFSGSIEQAKKIIDNGFYLGIGGVLTFKNSKLPQVVEEISLQHLVLETDSPYLAPTPYRGKRNESSFIRLVAEKMAEIKHCSLEEIARITTKNAEDVYGFI